jgi:hypothetical protein
MSSNIGWQTEIFALVRTDINVMTSTFQFRTIISQGKDPYLFQVVKESVPFDLYYSLACLTGCTSHNH